MARSRPRLRRTAPIRRTLALALLVAALAAPAFGQPRIGPQSGLPVPRFASLKFGVVNGREGPSLGHPVLWQYHRKGLPVLVIEEDLDWWKVRDPDGAEVWVHRRGLETRRMGLVEGAPAPVRGRPDDDAPVTAVAEPGVLFEIKDCREGWLRVDGARAVGWVHEGALWGPGCR